MGKNPHHHKPSTIEPTAIEKLAAEEMAAGRFRKARDHYKELCRIDKARYLPQLVEANRSLVTQLMQKEQVSEAEQVLVYLRTITPPDQLLELDLEFTLKSQDWQNALQCAVKICGFPDIAPKLHLKAADAIILAFPNLDAQPSLLPVALEAEARAIQGALSDLCAQQYDPAGEKLRPLPRHSIFAAWKVFLKGAIAFYSGDRDKARLHFAQLPPHGTPARAALAYSLFFPPTAASPQEIQAQAIRGACHILGTPTLGPALVAADNFWRKSQFRESYQEIRRLPKFPSSAPDVYGTLSDLYFKRPISMGPDEALRYASGFRSIRSAESFKNNIEACLISWMFACPKFGYKDLSEQEWCWRQYISHLPASEPHTSKLASLIFTRLACAFVAKDNEDDFLDEYEDDFDNLSQAILLYEESIRLNPQNLPAHLALAKLYEIDGNSQTRRKLLAKMTQLFPDNKAVLLAVGQECWERDAFTEALAAFYRVLEFDRIDPEILTRIAGTHLDAATSLYQNHDPAGGRAHFDALEPHLGEYADDFLRSKDCVTARRGVLETLYGDKATGERQLKEALETTPWKASLHLLIHSYFVLWRGKLKPKNPYLKNLAACLRTTPADRLRLFNALVHLIKTTRNIRWQEETECVQKCLKSLSGKDFQAEECLALLPHLAKLASFESLALAIVTAGCRKAPEWARFPILSILLNRPAPTRKLLTRCQALREQALKQGDKIAVKHADNLLSQLDSILGGMDPDSPEDDFSEDAHIGIKEILETITERAGEMSEAEFNRFVKTLPKDTPKEVIQLIHEIRAIHKQHRPKVSTKTNPAPKAALPAKPSKATAPKSKAPEKPIPQTTQTQPELF